MMKMLVVALSAAVSAGGCSIALQHKPLESLFAHKWEKCETSSKYWVADAVLAGLTGSGAIGARVYADSALENESTAYTLAGIGAVLAVTYLASAGNGRSWVSACKVQIANKPSTADLMPM